MKKNLLLYITALAALFTVSCARDMMPGTEMINPDGTTNLVMRVRSSAPQTKLVPSYAEDDLNEYVLEHFYYFIYKNDPSSVATEVPVYVGKWVAPEGERVVNKGTEENVPLDKFSTLVSADGNTYSGHVYIIANYKDATYAAALDAIVNAESPDYSTLTWEYLQNLPLPATFQSYNIVGGTEIMNEKQDEGHRFKPQDSFVMASEPTPFSVQKGVEGSIDADLKRLAAKVSIEIDMAKWYVQRNNNAYKYTWYSDPARTQVYLNYAADKGTMDGTPITYENAGDFFTYRRFAFVQDKVDEDGDYSPDDGSYKEKEPLKWIKKESPAATQPEDDGNYYTNDDDLVGKIVEVNGEIQYLEYNRPAYKITGTPFYSYPYDFTNDSGHAPFFKIIVEWTAYNETTVATDTQEGSKDNPEILGREFYYKITIPEIKVFQANQWIRINLHLSTLGSEADEAAIDVSSDTYFISNWSDPVNPDKPEINAGRYLNVSSPDKDSDGSLLFTMYGNTPIEIPVVTSHPIEISNVSSSYMNFYTGNSASLTMSTTSVDGNNFKLTPAPDNSYVKLEHTLVTTLASMQPRDVAKITYKFRIKHTGTEGNTYYKDITVVQFPPMYIEADPNSGGSTSSTRGYVYVNGEDRNQTNSNWYYVRPDLGNGGSDTNSNPNMYVVTVSVLETGSTDVIGDPRSGDSLSEGNPGWATAPTTLGGSNRELSVNYGRAGNNAQAAKTIAPKIRVASSWGAAGSYTFVNASRRCASYQEDGIPAGRWRLPTAAEIEFLVNLSAQNLMPRLFGTASGDTIYWCSNGSATVNNATHTVTTDDGASDTNTNTHRIRCVYDEWYWGETTNASPIRAQYRNTFTWGDEPR